MHFNVQRECCKQYKMFLLYNYFLEGIGVALATLVTPWLRPLLKTCNTIPYTMWMAYHFPRPSRISRLFPRHPGLRGLSMSVGILYGPTTYPGNRHKQKQPNCITVPLVECMYVFNKQIENYQI